MCSSRPALFSWLHITPDDTTSARLDSVVAARVLLELVEHRAGEGLADDDQVRHLAGLDRAEQLGHVELAVDEGDDAPAAPPSR